METTNSSHLPTSSRIPPAGQDSSETTDFTCWKPNRYPCTTLGNDNTSSGTPRRFGLENDTMRTGQANMKIINACQEEIIAPLGFEPEGSVSVLPYFERLFPDFDYVLDNHESRRVFHQYLLHENHDLLLDSWLACQKLKLMNPTESVFYRSVKEFYRRFIQNRDYNLPICPDLREKIAHGFRNHSLASLTFKLVGEQIYSQLGELYQRFLKSDFFANYCETIPNNHEKLKPQNLIDVREGFCQYEESSCSYPVGVVLPRENIYEVEKAEGLDAVSNPIKRGTCQHQYHRDYRVTNCQRVATTHQCHRQQHFNSDTRSDRMTLSSDPYTESDRYSAAGTFATDFSDPVRPRRDNLHTTRSQQSSKDGLPDIPHFKPRTQKLPKEGMKPMRPEEFAKILTAKLERVLAEREREENQLDGTKQKESDSLYQENTSCADSSGKDTLVPVPHSSVPVSHEGGVTGCYAAAPSCYDRYSVTGTSVSGGSEPVWRDSHQKYKNGAKGLASAVQHALRTELRECRCQQCLNNRASGGPRRVCTEQYTYPKSWHGHDGQSEYSCSAVTKPCSSCCRHAQCYHDGTSLSLSEHPPLTSSNLEQLGEPVPHPAVDRSRILEWMERNEMFQVEAPPSNAPTEPSHPSGTYKRHRTPVIYDTSRPVERSGHHIGNQPIASDPGMPPLPQPDTNTVLEEAKRRLEDNSRGKSSKLRHKTQRQQTHGKPHYSSHFDPAFSEKALSTTSGNWTASDSVSSVSRQVPSVISSSIPSSASKMWQDSKSDARSDAHTNMSHGSGSSSKGRRKEGTTITYFLAHEPIPYRTNLPGKEIRLSQFKALLTKKATFRYFFKTTSEDDGEMVYQEVKDDREILPMYEGKIVGKVEKVE